MSDTNGSSSSNPIPSQVPENTSDNFLNHGDQTNSLQFSTATTSDREKYLKVKEKLMVSRIELKSEKERKQKLYKGLVKLAAELKNSKAQIDQLKSIHTSEEKTWYDGGMWRAPELLPGIEHKQQPHSFKKEAVSLSDLFFGLVIVTAFTRVGLAIQDLGSLKIPQFFYFCIFWLIWEYVYAASYCILTTVKSLFNFIIVALLIHRRKETSFSTRFDTTDLSSQMGTLLTCFAVLFGSLGSKSDLSSGECTAVMVVALSVALLHFLLHLRVWFWFREVPLSSELVSVKEYSIYIMLLTGLESLSWLIGICVLPQDSKWRWLVFVIAIILSFRLPRTFLPNDFHAACSKHGVLFILTLGFIMQSIILVASPFFDYQTPNTEQFFFLGLPCFLLFCIKLLYVDDSFSVDPKDHALLVNRAAGFFFHMGQLSLLLSTTILGGGLNLLTQSYLAGIAALSNNAKALVCGGFSGVILSIAFIKSMHTRRLPTNTSHKNLFYAAYGTQIIVLLAVAHTTISLALDGPRYLGEVALSEIELLITLCSLCLFLLLISWLDEAVELNLYGQSDATEFRVHPFGIWTCLESGDPKPPIVSDTDTLVDRRLSHISPLLTNSNANLFDSQTFGENERNYGSLVANEHDDEEKGDINEGLNIVL